MFIVVCGNKITFLIGRYDSLVSGWTNEELVAIHQKHASPWGLLLQCSLKEEEYLSSENAASWVQLFVF